MELGVLYGLVEAWTSGVSPLICSILCLVKSRALDARIQSRCIGLDERARMSPICQIASSEVSYSLKTVLTCAAICPEYAASLLPIVAGCQRSLRYHVGRWSGLGGTSTHDIDATAVGQTDLLLLTELLLEKIEVEAHALDSILDQDSVRLI